MRVGPVTLGRVIGSLRSGSRSRLGPRIVPVSLVAVHVAALLASITLVLSYAGGTVLRPLLLIFLALVGTAAVVWPGSAAGLVVLLGVVTAYGVVTSLVDVLDLAAKPSALQVLLLAGCLYAAHAVDALRAALDGAAADSSVLLRWLTRLAQALLPGLAVGVAVLALPAGDGGSPLWLLGAVALLLATAVPALRVANRPWRRPEELTGGTAPDGPKG